MSNNLPSKRMRQSGRYEVTLVELDGVERNLRSFNTLKFALRHRDKFIEEYALQRGRFVCRVLDSEDYERGALDWDAPELDRPAYAEVSGARGEHEAEGRAVEAHQEAKHGDA